MTASGRSQVTPIAIRGARTHNLKGIDVDIPKHRLVAFTGVSGSGKSSLVFDTICTEAQRQLVETFSTYARRRLPQLTRPPGGALIFSGRLDDLLRTDTATSRALNDPGAAPGRSRRTFDDAFRIENATSNNLRNLSVRIPKGVLTCVTGVAGSGKSSLVAEFIESLRHRPAGAGAGGGEAVVVDQRPVGRSSRSNPATYVGVFDSIRRAFAAANRVSPALFSFNAKGSCANCKGRGFLEVELSFLDDVRLECNICEGRRYRDDVLKMTYHGRSIHDVLEMTVADALRFFASVEDLRKRSADIGRGLQLLIDVGVGYLRLGQSLSTLSGGEAQRLKLASELTRTGNVYVMDEPTTGLYPADIDRLLGIVERLIAGDNTVVVIEHNLDVIAAADWVVDLGPEGGKDGGAIVAEGTPETVAAHHATSHTGRYLKERLVAGCPPSSGVHENRAPAGAAAPQSLDASCYERDVRRTRR